MERNNLSGFWKKRSFLIGAAYYLAVALAIILLASPLFRVLGFEYSVFIALFASIHLLFFAAQESALLRGEGVWRIAGNLGLPVFILSSIPLAVSLLSVFFIPNCSLWDGVLFYIEIVFPTSLIATLCGVQFGVLGQSELRTRIYLAFFWIATVILGLLPGYFTAKIFTYGWQYGFFPGFVWDEAMDLRSGYWFSRIVQFIAISSWIIYTGRISQENREKGSNLRRAFIGGAVLFAYSNFLQLSDNDLDRYLDGRMKAADNIYLHFPPRLFTTDEKTLYSYEAKEYVREIDSIYGIMTAARIDIYVFSGTEDLYYFVGTREASITKPWKRSIYITKQNLRSLKHELTHAILSEYGSFPFDMSWSTGLTEGAAVAIEDDYDGIHSVDELSSDILRLNLSKGVRDVMQFSGFLSSAPSTSYVLSGSFAKYLISQYGSEKFLKVYHDRDFENIYSKSLAVLESDWKTSLKKFETPMDHYDSLRTLYYFKRTSILRQPCLRRIGKLIKNADESFRRKNYELADSFYETAMNESGRLKAIRGRVLSQLYLKNPQAALAILDTTPSAQEPQNLPALRSLRGDVIALAIGDMKKAAIEWQEAMKLELGDTYFMSAFLRVYFFNGIDSVAGVQKILHDVYSLEDNKDKYSLLFAAEPASSQSSAAFYKARLYLYTVYIERSGMLQSAYKIWKDGIKDIANYYLSKGEVLKHLPGEDLFDAVMAKKYSHYDAAFNDQSSKSKTLP